MTLEQARALKPGDRLRLRAGVYEGQTRENVELRVARVNRYSGPMGSGGTVTITVVDNEGREGTIQQDLLALVDEVLNEPSWYGDLMGEGPRD